jgi:hypothetical protein
MSFSDGISWEREFGLQFTDHQHDYLIENGWTIYLRERKAQKDTDSETYLIEILGDLTVKYDIMDFEKSKMTEYKYDSFDHFERNEPNEYKVEKI